MTDPGNIVPLYIPQLPYLLNGVPELAQLLFLSVTDGTNGKTQPAGPLTQSVRASPLTVTALYFPVDGGGGNGSTFIIDDAFSAIKGDFIDDPFVTVTTDASLTSDANVVGHCPDREGGDITGINDGSIDDGAIFEVVVVWRRTTSGNTINVPASASKTVRGRRLSYRWGSRRRWRSHCDKW